MSTSVDLLCPPHPRLSRQAQRIYGYLQRHARDGVVQAGRAESWLPEYIDAVNEIVDAGLLGLTADEAGYVLTGECR